MYEDEHLEAAYESAVTGDVDEDSYEPGPDCTVCGDEITGAIWTGGRCLHCHEAAMLPETDEDRWHDAFDD
jgi:hypothetical protein